MDKLLSWRNELLRLQVPPWLQKGLMAVGLFTLPITSYPLLARLARTNAVAPPTLVFFAAMVVLWLLPYLWRGGRLPRQGLPFIWFILAALCSSALAFFLPVPSFREGTLLGETLTVVVTLGMAAVYYFLMATWARQNERLAWVLRWVNYGAMLLFVWSAIQAFFILFMYTEYPTWLFSMQLSISTRHLFWNRLTGMAFEPSWLAHQLNTLYLPLWLAASLEGFTAHRRWVSIGRWRLTVENILLVCGALTLYFSFSRVGWLAFFLVLGVMALEYMLRFAGWVQQAVVERFHVSPRWAGWVRLGAGGALAVLALGLFAGAGWLMVHYGGRLDYRLDGLFQRVLAASDFYDLMNKLLIAERVIYWEVGWEVFGLFPLFGVGLGNAGFFFPQALDAFGWRLMEIRNTLYRASFVPNTKSLWTRLLSETGMIGFTLFVTWLYVLWRSGWEARRSSTPVVRVMARAGQFTIAAFLIEGFSVDTFGLPYLWVMLGLLSAAAAIYQFGEMQAGGR